MKIIIENTIDQAIEILEKEEAYKNESNDLISSQPTLISYLESEAFEILTDNEKDMLWYCTLVIFVSVKINVKNLEPLTIEALQSAEELNYQHIGQGTIKFKNLTDILFEHTQQEDLLAFVEDTLVPDEELEITPIGRKVLFVSLSTIIDAFDQSDVAN